RKGPREAERGAGGRRSRRGGQHHRAHPPLPVGPLMVTRSSPAVDELVTHGAPAVADDSLMAADVDAEAARRRVQLPRRVVLADDHLLILLTLREALSAREDFRVVGEARTGAAAVELVVETRADLLVVDLRLPDGDGLWAIREVRRRRPRTAVVVLSATE